MTISSWMSSLDDLRDLLELEVDMLERLLPPPPLVALLSLAAS